MLQDAVDYFNANTDIEFCAHLGDFWDTNYSNLGIVQPIYESLNADHHYSIGNHEYDDNGVLGGLNATSQMNLPTILGMPDWYYDFSVFNWRFIIIESYELAPYSADAHPEKQAERDSLLNEYPGPASTGCLSQDQLDFIDSTIATAHANDENVVLFAHHPLLDANANRNIRNAQSLIDIMESYDNVVAYMNGHAHTSSYLQQNGIHYVTFNDMKFSTPSTFSVIEVKYDTLEIQGFGNETDRTLTFNSKIQVLDADLDGVCDADDLCPGFDDALIGTSCDDNDACTLGETYDANCNCSGGSFQDQDGDGVCDADDVCPSFDDNLIGTSCEDGDVCTTGEMYDLNCNCTGGSFQDQDGDGVCDADDVCPSFDDNLIGTSCDDNNACTLGETYDANCNCSGGSIQDQDGDGVCDTDDVCPSFDDNLIGTSCEDGDVCTTGETYDATCTCTGGTFQDQDGDGICDALDIPESNCGSIFFLTGTASHNHYRVSNKIFSVQTIEGQEVRYTAPNTIELLNAFEVKLGTIFHAFIENCQ